MHVVIFEGSRWPTFAPLSLSRPVFTLVSGMSTLLEKQVRHLQPTRLSLWVRPELEEHCRVRLVPELKVPTTINQPLDDEPAMLVSGRSLIFNKFEFPPHDAIVTDDRNEIISCARVTRPGLSPQDIWDRTDRWTSLMDLPHMMSQTRMVESLWDLIHSNEESIVEDALQLRDRPNARPAGAYHMVREEEVWLGEGVKIGPGVVLDASKGPVVIGEHVSIGPNSVLTGPCHVGAYTVISPLSYIRPGASIGVLCKIGGEVSNSIIHGFTNKAHDGYLGDSYLGRWVNFGAGTTTSNLKNTYGEISVSRGGEDVPTGRRFLGALVGDHTKTAILTRLQAGSYLGFCSSIAGSGVTPRFVPSFTFLTDRGAESYRMEKAIEVTKHVLSRRDRVWSETDDHMMAYIAKAAKAVEGAAADDEVTR